LAELRELLADLPGRLLGLDEVDLPEEVPETGATFVANAVQKATYVRDRTGLPALADDSGLCVAALDGAPGVFSARYGGPGLSDRDRVQRLLSALADVPAADRGAFFISVLALARPGRPVVTVEGRVDGWVGWLPVGAGGFGYDPIFVLPASGRTMAELTADEKNAISHRANAARALRVLIGELRAAGDW
jgi:XTP/dITP diphosphohydrolase